MKLDLKDLKVDYPTTWEYKIITKAIYKIENILFDTVEKEYKIVSSNSSKSKKFISYTVSMYVETKEYKDKVLKIIHEHKDVYMVL